MIDQSSDNFAFIQAVAGLLFHFKDKPVKELDLLSSQNENHLVNIAFLSLFFRFVRFPIHEYAFMELLQYRVIYGKISKMQNITIVCL